MATEDEKREVLETIVRESERLRTLALRIDDGFLGYLLETVLHETRSKLIGAGHEVPKAERGGPSIVPLIPRDRKTD